jgi:hypothetical protein
MKRSRSRKERILMNESMKAKMPAEVKPWARRYRGGRVVEASGVLVPASADGF